MGLILGSYNLPILKNSVFEILFHSTLWLTAQTMSSLAHSLIQNLIDYH